MAQSMDELISLITDKVKQKLLAHGLHQNPAPTDQAPRQRDFSRPDATVDVKSLHTPMDLARYIDHTLLKPDASRAEIEKLCDEARQFHFYSVCVNSANVALCKKLLSGSQTIPIAVVGFPLGATTPEAKAFESTQAIEQGAQEIDMVINIGALKERDYALVLKDIHAVVRASGSIPVKVILETGLLEHDEKVIACVLSKVAGAAFVKTCTGFNKGSATTDDIKLMRQTVGPAMGVKASGGVRTTEDARNMIGAGANRIGASASVAIVTGKSDQRKGY